MACRDTPRVSAHRVCPHTACVRTPRVSAHRVCPHTACVRTPRVSAHRVRPQSVLPYFADALTTSNLRFRCVPTTAAVVRQPYKCLYKGAFEYSAAPFLYKFTIESKICTNLSLATLLFPNMRPQRDFFHTFATNSIEKKTWKDTRNAPVAAKKSLKPLRSACIARLG